MLKGMLVVMSILASVPQKAFLPDINKNKSNKKYHLNYPSPATVLSKHVTALFLSVTILNG